MWIGMANPTDELPPETKVWDPKYKPALDFLASEPDPNDAVGKASREHIALLADLKCSQLQAELRDRGIPVTDLGADLLGYNISCQHQFYENPEPLEHFVFDELSEEPLY